MKVEDTRRGVPGAGAWYWAAWRRAAGALIVCALATAVLGGCGGEDTAPPGAVGTRAPAYAAPTLEGDTLALDALRGEAVLVNVWATWCPPCREEMPGLVELHERFQGEGFRVVAASIDTRRAARDVRAFVDRHGITFPVLLDPEQRVTRAFRTVGVPESILLDREGRVVRRWVGEIDPLSEEIVESVREALMQEGGA